MINKSKDVNAYIANAPKRSRAKLAQIRKIIMDMAPEAKEGISYQIPFYKYHGLLAGFAAFKDHVSFFGASTLSIKQRSEFGREGYETSKGTVRIPFDRPVPVRLIKKLVRDKIKRNKARKNSVLKLSSKRKS